ncbi:MAG: DNA topoisomerase 4 subunit A [Clostridia bacterium]|nr:DNA topoisomerase 4 subunit A [Clostridia bacterium]
MPKKTQEPVQEEILIQMPLEEVMPSSMMPYAEHVILERALPRVEDGLKPVQRRILYTMHELGLTPDKPHRKCARIVGDCLGKYHPHGDSSVYEALVRMAQPYSMRGVLVDGHGNFGSIDGDSAAAMRYTEARMTPLAMEMLRDIEKDTVPFRLNFDDTLKEPELLPSRFPNLLVNGATGIAVGLATNIPPHNLRETVNATCLLLDNPEATTEDLMNVMPAPDFPTGGILLDTPELKAAYETGKGKLTLRARVEIEKGSAGRSLLAITEVPYGINKAQMLEKIQKLREEKKGQLSAIYDIRDESDRTGLRAVIELKKDSDPEQILAYLYKYSDLQITFGVNLFAIADGKPRLMGVREALNYYIGHQKQVVTRRTQYELEQAKARAHILEGLIVAVDNLDEVIAMIRSSKSGKEAKERLMERFGFTDRQAQAILDLRLQRLTGLEILALRKEYADILKTIATLEGILKSEKKLIQVIKKELQQVADEFGDDRRTAIIYEEHPAEIKAALQEAPLAEHAIVVLTESGLLRRYDPRTYEKINWEEQNERPRYILETDTGATMQLMTSLGNCYQLNVSQVAECRPKDRGISLSGIIADLSANEHCVGLNLQASDGDPERDYVMVTAKGMIKRTAKSEYRVRRSKFSALTLKDGDSLLTVFETDDEGDILLISALGMSIRFSISSVPQIGRAGAGVKAIRLELEDQVILAAPLENMDEILLITDNGMGKTILGAMFDPQGRAGKGAKCWNFLKNGSMGSRLIGALHLKQSRNILVRQGNRETVIPSSAFPILNLSDKGKPIVLVVPMLNDWVTSVM